MPMRAIQPKDESSISMATHIDPASLLENPRAGKRRCVQSACIPCRRRKSKCDGGQPDCSTCVAVYHTPCSYDANGDPRKKAALKRDIETLKVNSDTLEIIVACIKGCSDIEAIDIIKQIHATESLEQLAEALKRNIASPEHDCFESAEVDLSDVFGKLSLDESGAIRYFGTTSNLGLVSDNLRPMIDEKLRGAWTTVTQDWEFIQHLMDLYFCWCHPVHTVFPESLFLRDMSEFRSKYCSPVLVNAVLASSCLYSDRLEARTYPADPRTAGDHFFTEALRFLNSDTSASLTTCQAMAIMGIREASFGRDSSAFQYHGRSVQMALELGLHRSPRSSGLRFDPTELEVRNDTFWAIFTYETVGTSFFGRIAQIPVPAIDVVRRRIPDHLDQKTWMLYNDRIVRDLPEVKRPDYPFSHLHQFSMLCEITNDLTFTFYASRDPVTRTKVLELQARFTQWRNELPSKLQLHGETQPPHVLILHLFYHASIIHLFRPFLKLSLSTSEECLREVCTASANSIASIVGVYRQTYGFRQVHPLLIYVLLSSNTVDLVDLPRQSAARNLQLGLECLREQAVHQSLAARSLKILAALAEQWNIQLPTEIAHAMYEYSREMSMIGLGAPGELQSPPTPTSISSPSSQEQDPFRSLSSDDIDFRLDSPHPFVDPNDAFWLPLTDYGLPLDEGVGTSIWETATGIE